MVSWNIPGRLVLRIGRLALGFFWAFTALAQNHELVPPGLETLQIKSEADFVEEWAKENGWEDSQESLRSYLKTELKVKDPKLGTVRLCRLANAAQPRGGEQTLVLLQKNQHGLFLFSPVARQEPPTPDYKQTVVPKRLQTICPTQGSGRFLLLEVQEEVQEHDQSSDTIHTTRELFGYAFVNSAAPFVRCVAYRIPLKVTRLVNGNIQESFALQIRFPDRKHFEILKKSSRLTPGQEQWIGKTTIED
ncbi:MAG: hypothetical protein H6Q30_951 [Bacteroidetes bacterium]|nr:hypothetical protein [Bacteroidota bacterium]